MEIVKNDLMETMENIKTLMTTKTTTQGHQKDSSKTIEEQYEKLGVGTKYYKKDFSNFEHSKNHKKMKLLEICIKFAQSFPVFKSQKQGLFLSGKPGTGKTHLTMAIIKEILKKGYENIKIYNTISLLNEIKSTYSGRSSKSEHQILESCKKTGLLILDDFGKEYSKTDSFGNSWVSEKLYNIINYRYENEKAIIITTNYTMDDLEKKLDSAIISRLFEMCIGYILDWEDYRRS